MNINFAQLEIAGESNIGTVRHHNEDNFLIFAPPGGQAVLAAVADGIGGHSRGEVASHICCRELLRAARNTDSARWDEDFLLDSLRCANERIFNFNYSGKRIKPMGCTVAAAIFFSDRVIIASAGDSRIYEYLRRTGGKSLRQLTEDHRPEGYLDWLKDERFRHVSLISRALGTGKYLELDHHQFPRHPEAKYMLCSDGLYNRQNNRLIAGVLSDESSMRSKCSTLLRGALLSGERDNITVICAGTAKKEYK